MKLKGFLRKYYPNIHIRYNHIIDNITDYDKDVNNGCIYVCLKDETYVDSAINNGVKTIVLDKLLKKNKIKRVKGINYIFVDSPIVFCARVINEVLCSLTKKPIMIGLTGTSGKTTTLHLLYEYLKNENYDILAIGTHFIYSYYGLKENKVETNNTTISLCYLFKLLKEKNFDYDYVIMEVSSEGISKGRILGLSFDIVSVSNILSDHLNYHKTIESYIHAKERLLYQAKEIIILNYDDEIVKSFNKLTIKNVLSYGINSSTNIKAKYIEYYDDFTKFYIEDSGNNYFIVTSLLGKFNVYNILNSWCIIKALNLDLNLFIKVLNNKIVIPGRMNEIKIGNCKFIVDYAHTVNEVKEVFDYILKVKKEEFVITIIGCGGSRDKSKRSIIGKLVTTNSDYVYFTEDNSRDEDVLCIINDITSDLSCNNYEVVINRIDAINKAYQNYKDKNTIILVLGKGSENYIIKNNIKYPYSDIDEINKLYE